MSPIDKFRKFYYDLKKKKVLVVCLAGCALGSVIGFGNYDRKKKFQSSVWRVVSFWFWRLRPEKKVPVVCLAGCAVVVLAITTGKKKVPVVCLAGCAVASVFSSGD